MPLLGKAQRMKDAGYYGAKPLMMVTNHKNILEMGIDSIDTSECRMIFIVRADQPEVSEFIKKKWPEAVIVVSDKDTKGSLYSVALAEEYIYSDFPLIVFNSDVFFAPKYVPKPEDFQDGLILTFKSNSPNYSYVASNSDGFVIRTAEKEVISHESSVGLYCFKNGKSLIDYISFAPITRNEAFVCPFYNILIEKGMKIRTKMVDKMLVAGTPEEYEFVRRYVFPHLVKKKFVLFSCHSGYTTKSKIKDILDEQGLKYVDVGPSCKENCDYPDYVSLAAEYIKDGYFGIGSCMSGQGINIACNKEEGVISALVDDHFKTARAIEHNFANCISIPDSLNLDQLSLEFIIEAILKSSPDGSRHQVRLQKVIKKESLKCQKKLPSIE